MNDPNQRDYGGVVGYTDSGTGSMIADDKKTSEATDLGEVITVCLSAVAKSVDITVGVGSGLNFDCGNSLLGAGVGGYGNYIQGHIENGTIHAEVATDIHATATIYGLTFGFGHTSIRNWGETEFIDHDLVFFDQYDTLISVYSSSIYLLFAGYSIDVKFNIGTFFDTLMEAFGG